MKKVINIFAFAGQKGGIGKSTGAQAFATSCMLQPDTFVAILDGDPTQPDVYRAFYDYRNEDPSAGPRCVVAKIDATLGDKAFLDLFGQTFNEGITHTFLNLPANNNPLEEVRLIKYATEALEDEYDMRWTVFYIISSDEKTPECVLKSCQSGYLSIGHKRVLLRNGAACAGSKEVITETTIPAILDVCAGQNLEVSEELPTIESYHALDFREGEHRPLYYYATMRPDTPQQMLEKSIARRNAKAIFSGFIQKYSA